MHSTPQFFILVALLLVSLILAGALALAWAQFDRPRHAMLWAVAFLLGALQWSCNLLQDWLFADKALYWCVVNAIPLLTLSFAVVGHRVRRGWSSAWGRWLLLAALAEGLIVWFTVVQPHLGLRMAIQPIFAGLMLGVCAWTVVSGTRRSSVAWAVALMHGGLGAALLLAATSALLQGATPQEPYLGWYLQINFLLLPAGYVGTGVADVFLLANDLSTAMRRQAQTDLLTGVLNRRGFEARIARLQAAATLATAAPLSLVLTDIDAFKSINDRYGHPAGDAVLQAFARELTRHTRPDNVARLGGEEFVVLLPATPLPTALDAAERLRAGIADAPVVHAGQSIRLSASFGVAATAATDQDVYDTLKRADLALYRAKHSGRNRVEMA